MMQLTIIIATCGRPERLRVTLEHVLRAAERVDGCKVIVVDNHPDYAAEAVVEGMRALCVVRSASCADGEKSALCVVRSAECGKEEESASCVVPRVLCGGEEKSALCVVRSASCVETRGNGSPEHSMDGPVTQSGKPDSNSPASKQSTKNQAQGTNLPAPSTKYYALSTDSPAPRTKHQEPNTKNQEPSTITYLRSAPFNKAKALNVGIAAADTEWLAFTDDDTLPQEDWLEEGMRHARESGLGVFGGRVLPEEVTQIVPRWMRPGHSGRVPHIGVIVCHDPLEVSGAIGPSDPAPFGANVFVRRDLFATHGGYDEELWEMCRTHWSLGSEDSDFGHRLKTRGERIGYCREAVVVHPVNYDRLSLRLHVWRAYCEGWRQPLIFAEEHRRPFEWFRARVILRLATGGIKDLVSGDVAGAAERVVEVARCWGAVIGRWSKAHSMRRKNFNRW